MFPVSCAASEVSTLTCTSKSLELLKKTFKQYEAEAESRTKTNLVIEAVAKAEGFDASEEEIKKKSSNWQQTTTWKLHKFKLAFS